MARLVAVQGPLVGESFEIYAETVIGRAADCCLCLDDMTVSRRHARIRETSQGFFVEDVGSGNGTFVNHRRLTEPTLLVNDDLIRVSTHAFKFIQQDPQSSTSVMIEERNEATESSIVGKFHVESTQVAAVTADTAAGEILKAHKRLRTILDIGNAVQNEFSVPLLLDRVIDALFEVFPQADRGFLMLMEQDGKLRQRAARTRHDRTEQIAVSRKIISEVVQKRVAVLSADACDDSRFGGAVSVVNYQIRSMMCAPLIARGEILGIIHLDTVRLAERFTQEDLELLTGVAGQTALALANARMHEDLIRRQRIQRDLELASQVQNSFLPDCDPDVEGMEFMGYYRAALEVGGDFYDYIPQSEDRMIVAIGDVSGKGVPAALLMAKMTSDVRFHTLQAREPVEIITRLNERLNDARISDVFVTLMLAAIDLESSTVTIASAGHCPALLRSADGAEIVRLCVGGSFPLGVERDGEYSQESRRLKPGEVVCLYTDGIPEAMDAQERLYGYERFHNVFANGPGAAGASLRALVADVQEFVGDVHQSDDLTCVCFGVNPPA